MVFFNMSSSLHSHHIPSCEYEAMLLHHLMSNFARKHTDSMVGVLAYSKHVVAWDWSCGCRARLVLSRMLSLHVNL